MPFPPSIAVVSHQFLLLGVHADHRLAGSLKRQNLFVDMAELPVPVGMALAFIAFALTLQAVAQLMEQLRRLGRTDLITLLDQLLGQPPDAFTGPQQRTHWIATGQRADQTFQGGQQGGLALR